MDGGRDGQNEEETAPEGVPKSRECQRKTKTLRNHKKKIIFPSFLCFVFFLLFPSLLLVTIPVCRLFLLFPDKDGCSGTTVETQLQRPASAIHKKDQESSPLSSSLPSLVRLPAVFVRLSHSLSWSGHLIWLSHTNFIQKLNTTAHTHRHTHGTGLLPAISSMVPN